MGPFLGASNKKVYSPLQNLSMGGGEVYVKVLAAITETFPFAKTPSLKNNFSPREKFKNFHKILVLMTFLWYSPPQKTVS